VEKGVRRIGGPVLLLFVVLSSSGGAQEPPAPQTQTAPVFRSGAHIVALNVTVMDTNKQFVTGLTADDFLVYEDGVQQQVRFFESGNVPLDLIVLIDTSSSMLDKMDVVHEAASGFLRGLRPGDRGAVVTFNDGVKVLEGLTEDRAALETAVRSTQAKGATSLHNALYVSLKQFGRTAQQSGEVRRQAIAVLSDGEDTSSLISFDDVLGVARKSGVAIYTISLQSKYAAARLAASGQRRYFSESEYSMKTLAHDTGAQAFFPLQISELKGIYGTIAQDLAHQYSIAYSPANPRPDGKYRRIVVRVNDRPELQLRTRMGYVAEATRAAAANMQQR
jgi:Ca-activated chloride channel family protein